MTDTDSGIISLPRVFASRYGAPIISQVDTAIFTLRYFTHCMQCDFCHDGCCVHGVDVDLLHAREIDRHAERLEAYTGIPRTEWFWPGECIDPDLPGGGYRRTRVVDGACVFLNRKSRGCLIHAYCLERGIDYHELKSIVDCLFPLSFDDGTLGPADDIVDGELICAGVGPSVYRGLRDEIRYYFGAELVAALDGIADEVATGTTGCEGRR